MVGELTARTRASKEASMVHILKSTAKFEPDELVALLRERPQLLHPKIRFLQGPFPIQNLGRLDLLGLDEHGGWVLVKIASEGNGELLLSSLHQITWVQNHSSWITTMPAYELADAASLPSVFLLAPHFSNSLGDVLRYLQGLAVGLVKYSGFDLGDQKAIHFEPLFDGVTQDKEADKAAEDSNPVPEVPANPELPAGKGDEPNLSLLQPLTEEEIAEFLPGNGKEKTA